MSMGFHIHFPLRNISPYARIHGIPGCIAFAARKCLPGVGFARAEWNAIKDMQSGTVTRQVTDTMRLAPLDSDDVSEVTSKILNREANEEQAVRIAELRSRAKINLKILNNDNDDISKARIVKPEQRVIDPAGPVRTDLAVLDYEPEMRRTTSDKEIEARKESNRAAQETARAELAELQRIDEVERRKIRRMPHSVDEETMFSAIEREEILKWIGNQAGEKPSPRTIRTQITRYLLGRLLISTFGFKPDTKDLIAALSAQPLREGINPEELRAYQRVASALRQLSE